MKTNNVVYGVCVALAVLLMATIITVTFGMMVHLGVTLTKIDYTIIFTLSAATFGFALYLVERK